MGCHHAEDFRDVIDVNVTGVWNTVMAGAQKIIDGGRGGSIILISSAAGIKMQPFMVHYTASKHAVTGMAAPAAELGHIAARPSNGDAQLAQMITPFLDNWAAEPEDIADAACWLASDESKNVTAAAIPVDQGMTQY